MKLVLFRSSAPLCAQRVEHTELRWKCGGCASRMWWCAAAAGKPDPIRRHVPVAMARRVGLRTVFCLRKSIFDAECFRGIYRFLYTASGIACQFVPEAITTIFTSRLPAPNLQPSRSFPDSTWLPVEVYIVPRTGVADMCQTHCGQTGSILSPGQGWHRRANAQKCYKSPPNGLPIN